MYGEMLIWRSQPGGVLDYYSLIWITLQRAATAREAIQVIDNLTNTYSQAALGIYLLIPLVYRYGYASTGESFSISDPEEVWILELIGKGKIEKGTVWVARLVPDGHVCGHANQARIQTWPRNTSVAMWASDIVDFAIKAKLYPSTADPVAFSFSDIFDPVSPAGARLCELRVWNFFRQVIDNGSAFAQQYLDYVQGHNLANRMPLTVPVAKSVTLNETMWYMRAHYGGTSAPESALMFSFSKERGLIRPRISEQELSMRSFVRDRQSTRLLRRPT